MKTKIAIALCALFIAAAFTIGCHKENPVPASPPGVYSPANFRPVCCEHSHRQLSMDYDTDPPTVVVTKVKCCICGGLHGSPDLNADSTINSISGATVEYILSGTTTVVYSRTTNEDGHWDETGISDGTYEVRFSKIGYYTNSVEDVVILDGEAQQPIRLGLIEQ